MNAPESTRTYAPKQAIAPTPALYDELVGDCMEKLAQESLLHMPPLTSGSLIHDNGCGTGAASAAVAASILSMSNRDSNDTSPINISIKGTDINAQALAIYRQHAATQNWPAAEAMAMDSNALAFPDDTFTHSIGNALLFVLPDDGEGAVKEMYRTLKPGGVAVVNCWAYVPNMGVVQAAARATRPVGTPVPRKDMDRWANEGHIRGVLERGGFAGDKVRMVKREVVVCTAEVGRFAEMLWSFIGGTSSVGWLEEDEENWERAVEVVKEELGKTDGYRELEGGRLQLKFVAHIGIATK